MFAIHKLLKQVFANCLFKLFDVVFLISDTKAWFREFSKYDVYNLQNEKKY